MTIAYLLRPLIGALIGYITNYIAIRMLFRPRRAKYLFGYKIPFTPGLIPKEKSRIAASIGDAISKNLMNREVVERSLLAPDMIARIEIAFDNFVLEQSASPEPLGEYLSRFLSADDLKYLRRNVSADLAGQIHSSLSASPLGSRIARIVVEHVMAKIENTFLGRLGADRVVGMIAAPLEKQLARNIDEMLAANSRDMIRNLLEDQTEALLATPMRDLFAGRQEQIDRLRDTIINLYRRLVTEQLPRILDAVNISNIIEGRINEMDVAETERLILEVMNRELKAIVWLGALLGFAMGCINLLF